MVLARELDARLRAVLVSGAVEAGRIVVLCHAVAELRVLLYYCDADVEGVVR